MATKVRKVNFDRKSKETQIKGTLNVDGKGMTKIKTPIGLLSHMLELFAFHGFFDLTLDVKGDTHIDIHHTNEDIGIALGKAFKQALGENNKSIRRFGSGFAPMESTLGHTVVDICGRAHHAIRFLPTTEIVRTIKSQDNYSIDYLDHFLESFAKGLGATIQITITGASTDLHTTLETVFKSLGLAMEQAVKVDPRRKGVPSTKGIID